MSQPIINQAIVFAILFFLSAGVLATIYVGWKIGKSMKLFDLYVLVLIAAFVVGVLGAMITGNVWWLALSVIPGAIFTKWWRVG